MADVTGIIAKVTKSSTPVIQTSAGTALAANNQRSAFIIQNLGTNPLFVKLGTGASTTDFHFILKAGTGADDGLGGIHEENTGVIYTGIITVAGTTPRFMVNELYQ